MKIMKTKFVSVLLVLAVTLTMCLGSTAVTFAADQCNRVNLKVTVDGKEPVTVKAYNASYTYNTYVSLNDLASALTGSQKNMDVKYNAEKDAYYITTGTDYVPLEDGDENKPFDETYRGDLVSDGISLDVPECYINDKYVEYRMYPMKDKNDAYMKLVDLGLVFGIDIEYVSYDELKINTAKEFEIDMDQLEEDEYFHDLDGVFIGNATTGEKLYGWDEKHQTEIASTSKLMTYLLVQEAIDAGKVKLTDTYKISEAALEEANSEDGTSICYKNWTLGKEVVVKDLIAGMLMPSANECATALAEVIAGSEAEFVKLMNARAKELGLKTAKFVNAHGLPNYVPSQVTGKRQNKMCAEDMFKLVSYLMKNHKADLETYTAVPSMEVPSFGEGVVANSTYKTLIYNMGVVGLKTGTTNRSGACIVTAIDVKVGGKTQTVVSVIFGAEDNRQRYEASNMALKYAQQYYAKQEIKNAEIKAGVENTTVKATAKVSGKNVKVSWTKSKGYKVDGYKVYKATSKSGTYKYVGKVKGTAFTHKNTTKGYYKVKGYRTVAGETVYTKVSNVTKAK